MDIFSILVLVILIAGFAGVFWFLSKNRGKPEENQGSFVLLQNQLQELARTMDQKLGEGTGRMFESMKTQFGESQRLASDIRDLVTKQLTEVAREQTKTNEATTRFMTIAEQLANLEKVLKHQKQRG